VRDQDRLRVFGGIGLALHAAINTTMGNASSIGRKLGWSDLPISAMPHPSRTAN
jgi:hypothetical protein